MEKPVPNSGATPANAATGYHLKNAVTGTSSLNYAINYEKVITSIGDLLPAEEAEIQVITAAKLDFSWVNNAPVAGTAGTDKATVLVYNPTKDKFVTLAGAAPRSAGAYVLQLPANFSGDNVHAWISFVSVDGKEVSNSFYVGEFLVL